MGAEAAAAQQNLSPPIALRPLPAMARFPLVKNTSLVLDVSATDPDGDTLIFTLTGEDAGLFDITEDGQLNFATAPDLKPRATPMAITSTA